ncbi:hypothetical protein JCM10207_005580, partial [Rhodosporidiobolus poonsookiae]
MGLSKKDARTRQQKLATANGTRVETTAGGVVKKPEKAKIACTVCKQEIVASLPVSLRDALQNTTADESIVVVPRSLQAFSVSGSMYLSILGGALWGVAIALPLVCTCVATGALLCYLMSAALGPPSSFTRRCGSAASTRGLSWSTRVRVRLG